MVAIRLGGKGRQPEPGDGNSLYLISWSEAMFVLRKSVSTQLYAVIGLAAIAMLILLATSLVGSSQMADAGRGLFETGLTELKRVNRVETQFERMRGLVARAPAELDLERQTEFRNEFNSMHKELTELVAARIAEAVPESDEAETLGELSRAFADAGRIAGEVFEFAASFAQDQANQTLKGPFAGVETRIGTLIAQRKARAEEMAASEFKRLNSTQFTTLVAIAAISVVAIIAALGFGGYVARRLSGQIMSLTEVMEKLANSETDLIVPHLDQRNELGDMARAVEIFKQNAVEKIHLESDKLEQEERGRLEKRRAMNELADDFESNVKEVVETISQAAGAMRSTAQTMASRAEQARNEVEGVNHASNSASSSVQTVAAAAEELSKSISEINRQVTNSHDIANEAVNGAERASSTVAGLAEAAQKIGDVVNLIQDIAEQTNLLALNATIEAARAGEAGKGFAVVASEVKNLANQTAKATEEISEQILGMQSATSDTVEAIDTVRSVINKIGTNTTAVAGAITEQTAATEEISRNVQQVADGTNEISSNIRSVTEAATDTGVAAQEVYQATNGLTVESQRLADEVAKFLGALRAA
jgi:methyl-accepting chemotaxis protein